MTVDLRTITIEPQRQAYDHLVRRFGDKPASRYQEGSYDLQATENLHYRPTWEPGQELYDTSITRIVLDDWHVLKDPRQFYYQTYTVTRARQQESAESNFTLAQTRGLVDGLNPGVRETALRLLVPLRHVAWGANQNNTLVSGYGFGMPWTQACMYYAMDSLAVAQYLSRIGLLLGDADSLAAAKSAWLEDGAWQPLRRHVEDLLVIRDPFELFLAQDLVLDGLLYPLVYSTVVDGHLSGQGGATVAILTQFMTEWFGETRKWVDSVVSAAAAASAENRAVLNEWLTTWRERAAQALTPVAEIALGASAGDAVAAQVTALNARAAKAKITD